MGQLAFLEKMTLVWGKDYPPQKNRVSKASTNSSSHGSDHEDYKDPLGSNKPLNKSLSGTPVTLTPKAPTDVARYTEKDIKQII